MKTLLKYAIIIIITISSCIPENPFLSDEEVNRLNVPDKFELAIIKNNDVFLISGDGRATPKQLTFDATPKSEVKINFDGTKIAYLDKNNKPFVIDVPGHSIEAITATNPIIQMDWIDSGTLYMFDGKVLTYHGNQISTPSLIIPGSLPINVSKTIKSVCVNSSGELAYIVEYYNGYDMSQLLILKKSANENEITSESHQYLNKVYFNAEGKLIVLISNLSTNAYLFNDIAEYGTFDEALTANSIWKKNLVDSYTGYISLVNRQIVIYCKESSLSGYYDLFIQDYGKADYETSFKEISNTKLYFDFK